VKSVKSVIQHLTLRACVLIDCDGRFIPVCEQDRESPTSPTSPTNTVPMWLVMSGIFGVNLDRGEGRPHPQLANAVHRAKKVLVNYVHNFGLFNLQKRNKAQ
jgi:hypothetical protein